MKAILQLGEIRSILTLASSLLKAMTKLKLELDPRKDPPKMI
jgi:hypothetical protein